VGLLLPIVTLAVRSRLGTDEFVYAVKCAYVRAAIDEAFADGSKVNYSRLAVITGLTRKEVSVLVRRLEGGRAASAKESKQQRALGVVRGWSRDPRFQDRKGRPAELPLKTGRRTFDSLVRAYARDVTPKSVLTELERLRLVTRAKTTRSLRLLSTRSPLRDTSQTMLELTRLLGDFVNTVDQRHSADGPPVFFSFRDAMLALPQQSARFERVFSSRAAALLDSFDEWIASQPPGADRGDARARRVGLGVYLVRDVPGGARKQVGHRTKGGKRRF
jgi:hypothetical protein